MYTLISVEIISVPDEKMYPFELSLGISRYPCRPDSSKELKEREVEPAELGEIVEASFLTVRLPCTLQDDLGM